MNAQQLNGHSAVPAHRFPPAAIFLKSLGQSIKVCTLYKADHPVAVGALGEAFKAFDDILRISTSPDNILSLVDGQWLWNGISVLEAEQGPEALKTFFGAYGLHSLVFLEGLRFHELSAFCELVTQAPASREAGSFLEILAQKGIKSIIGDSALYTRIRNGPLPPPPPEVKISRAAEAASPAQPKRKNENFSQLLRQLVETAVEDPEERTHIYKDAVSLVRRSMDRHVAEATAALAEDKQRILSEQFRTEKVLSTIAMGKVIVDQSGRVLMMNQAAEEISGKRLSEVAGRPVSESVSGRDRMLAVSRDIAVDLDKPLSQEVQVVGDTAAGQSMKRSVALIHDESGRVVGTYAVMPDVLKFQEARKVQEEFLQRVTHDLKAPLTSICCALDLLEHKAGAKLSPEEFKFLDTSLRNSRQLADMIAKILDFSKIESGQLSISPSPVAADGLIREAVESLMPWALRRRVVLEAAGSAPGLPNVLAESQQAVHILTNLISNAIKSTPAEGRVTVKAYPGGEVNPGMVVFSVADTGCGIAPENQERIFEKFIQAPPDGERREGVGLGLAIVRELVALHHGAVWVESAPGKGSTFCFTLPLAESAP
ncbi:MAG: PAS domain-containing protein [Elusimicrobia bacterium]|nr:PAS domain-containing protein [Elusimicrobiota bacterium]